jgi:4-hydroxy-tetrahydrodipicolinate synthase
MKTSISGVFSALATPIDEQGRPDAAVFAQLIDFVMDRGVDGIVIGGGTAEYPHFEVETRIALARQAVECVAGRGPVITCVGTSSIFTTLALARGAADAGSNLLLLPMPHFFHYSQDDLVAYTQAVCSAVPVPFLLYNLPSFTGAITAATALQLMRTIPNLIGIKDSSGDRQNLRPLGKACEERVASVLVGDDCLLLDALQAGWSGTVSGIGCFVPELILAVYRSHRAGETERAAQLQAELNALIKEVVRLPIPWGVRACLDARGVPSGPMHLPLSSARQEQVAALREWLRNWAQARGLELNQIWDTIRA